MAHPRWGHPPMITSLMRQASLGAKQEVGAPAGDIISDRSVARRIGLRSCTYSFSISPMPCSRGYIYSCSPW